MQGPDRPRHVGDGKLLVQIVTKVGEKADGTAIEQHEWTRMYPCEYIAYRAERGMTPHAWFPNAITEHHHPAIDGRP